jgi:hypothetical protein
MTTIVRIPMSKMLDDFSKINDLLAEGGIPVGIHRGAIRRWLDIQTDEAVFEYIPPEELYYGPGEPYYGIDNGK